MKAIQRLRRNYRAAFFRYLPSREEAALAAGYEIGRSSADQGLTILDIAHVHHDILREVLTTSSPEEIDGVTAAASDFLAEVLATYEMASRGYLESP